MGDSDDQVFSYVVCSLAQPDPPSLWLYKLCRMVIVHTSRVCATAELCSTQEHSSIPPILRVGESELSSQHNTPHGMHTFNCSVD